jgi:predicted CXXCH cytochrome family protein
MLFHVMTRMEAEAAPGHRHSGRKQRMMRSVSFAISKYFRQTSIFRGIEMNKNRVIKKLLVLLTAILSLLFFIATSLYSDSLKERPHGDKNKLPKGCGSCHMGHGAYNTPMLTARKDSFCFRCHGQNFEIEKAKHEGALAQSADPADIQTEFEKPYRHPVGKTGIHRFG